jgi:hypothetical protein
MPTRELAEANLSEGEAEKQISDETAEEEFAAGWPVSATGDEYSRGDQVDLPIVEEEVQ